MSNAVKYRPDIDGLRAVAVLSVIGFHFFGVRGGFVGVDIFFVISGYLISKILLSELKSGDFSFVNFYERRIRRIFPALIVVLFSCFLLGWATLLANEFELLGKHLVAGATFSSNIILWLESGYFDRASDLKPLLHLWSLGVEEQFYIFWPLLLGLAFWGRWIVRRFILLLIAGSFLCNLYFSSIDAVYAFYWLPTRMWELLCGAFLAYASSVSGSSIFLDRWNTHSFLKNVIPLMGLGLILLALIYIEPRRSYPSYWALIPVFGALFILAGNKDAWVNKYIFSNSLLVKVGLISYPLYLWHWPLISFAKIMNNGGLDRGLKIGCFLLSFVLAYLTYIFVEKKYRYITTLKNTFHLVFGMLLIGLLGLIVFLLNGISARHPHQESVYIQSRLLDQHISQFDWDQKCIQDFKALNHNGDCRIADNKRSPTVLLVGDSHAISFYPGLAYEYAAQGENLQLVARGACVPLLGIETHRDGLPDVCEEIMSEIYGYARSQKTIKTVIVAFRGPWYLHGGGTSYAKKDLNPILLNGLSFEQAMIKTYDSLSSANKNMVLLLDNPELGFHPQECVDIRPVKLKGGVRENCFVTEGDARSIAKVYREKVLSIKNQTLELKIVDTFNYFCEAGLCSAINNGRLLYDDDNHLSLNGSFGVADKFMRLNRNLLIFDQK